MARLLRKALVVLVGALVVALALAALALRRANTRDFQQSLVRRAEAALGTRLGVERVELGLLSGVRLERIVVANPPPFRGELLTAEALVLRPRLTRLLLGRLEIDRLELRRPVLALAADSHGRFNYERLGGRSGPGAGAASLPLRVELSRASIEGGTLTVSDASRASLLRLERLAATSSLSLGAQGARAETRGRGALSGAGLRGNVVAEARFERRSAAQPVTGRGKARIDECRVEKSALFSLLAASLRLPELARPDLDECRVEFELRNGRVVTPVLALKGQAVQLEGAGSVTLASGALDYEMRLALASALVERIPAKELRAAFRPRGDGYGSLPFALRGTTARPETDIAARLAKAAAGEAAKNKLERVLGKIL